MKHQSEPSENDQNRKPDKFLGIDEIEVSIVMPCLNEEATVATCIEKTCVALKQMDVKGEIIVADNGSTDASVEIVLPQYPGHQENVK
ncbi:MAG: hypothetical protein DRJ47_08790 [Thermoprotei archaeon]|nr:MAG: hypothetical protein DRJ47_08790 [Thermoprotei archaeon]